MKFGIIAAAAGLLAIAACESVPGDAGQDPGSTAIAAVSQARLADVLEARPEEARARYGARHPAETLAFFGIEPGMTVVEALPGGGWYTKILLPYLGPDGTLVGAHYPDDIWATIMPDAEPERVEAYIARTNGWQAEALEWTGADGPQVGSLKMTTAPAEMVGEADVVLFIRAMHNLYRVEDELGYFSAAIEEAHDLLRPGGVVGVVQHRAGEDTPDDWADGNAGYLKQSDVIAAFEAAGFDLQAASEVNANPADRAGPGDIVWRLPPSLATTEEGTPEHAAMEAIGESDRMTLRFVKPQ